MENRDKPINPVLMQVNSDGSRNGARVENTTYYESGLTKREYFAAMAMQGILSGTRKIYSASHVAYEATEYADALLKELERE